MDRPTRFEITLPADRRQDLNDLANDLGLSASDLARLAIARLLAARDELVAGPQTRKQKRCRQGVRE